MIRDNREVAARWSNESIVGRARSDAVGVETTGIRVARQTWSSGMSWDGDGGDPAVPEGYAVIREGAARALQRA